MNNQKFLHIFFFELLIVAFLISCNEKSVQESIKINTPTPVTSIPIEPTPNASRNVREYINRSPFEFVNSSFFKPRFQKLLGSNFEEFLNNLSVGADIEETKDGFIKGSGCFPHQCNVSDAAFVLDPQDEESLEVILHSNNRILYYSEDHSKAGFYNQELIKVVDHLSETDKVNYISYNDGIPVILNKQSLSVMGKAVQELRKYRDKQLDAALNTSRNVLSSKVRTKDLDFILKELRIFVLECYEDSLSEVDLPNEDYKQVIEFLTQEKDTKFKPRGNGTYDQIMELRRLNEESRPMDEFFHSKLKSLVECLDFNSPYIMSKVKELLSDYAPYVPQYEEIQIR